MKNHRILHTRVIVMNCHCQFIDWLNTYFGCEFTELLAIGRNMSTCADQLNWNQPAPDIVIQLGEQSDVDDDRTFDL